MEPPAPQYERNQQSWRRSLWEPSSEVLTVELHCVILQCCICRGVYVSQGGEHDEFSSLDWNQALSGLWPNECLIDIGGQLVLAYYFHI